MFLATNNFSCGQNNIEGQNQKYQIGFEGGRVELPVCFFILKRIFLHKKTVQYYMKE